MAEEELNNNIIIDSGSSIEIYINPHLVMNIKRSNHEIHLYINMGYKTNQMQGMVPDYVKVCYVDKAIENIFSLTNLVKKYRVTYDSHQYDAFAVHTNRGIIKFSKNKKCYMYSRLHILK